jgi:U3 small nucleolar RNA-associated protein 21
VPPTQTCGCAPLARSRSTHRSSLSVCRGASGIHLVHLHCSDQHSSLALPTEVCTERTMAIEVAASSVVLEPFRAVGVVSGDAPAAVQFLGTETFLSIPVGGSLHVYDANELTLRMVTNPVAGDIELAASWKEVSAAVVDSSLFILRRAHPVNTVRAPTLGPIDALLAIGHLLVVGHRTGAIRTFDLKRLSAGSDPEESLVGAQIELALPGEARVSRIVHPPSWLNKVLVACTDGRFRVVNLRTGKCVFTSALVSESADAAERADDPSKEVTPSAGLSWVETSPAADVVAFGLQDGRVVVHNCRLDKSVSVFQHGAAAGHTVTALSFCTDPARPARLASATAAGDVALWDLAERRLVWHQPGAHAIGVSTLCFLPKEPRFVSVGPDNAIRQWLLDGLDELPRVLRQRSGHFGPVKAVRFAHRDPIESAQSDGADPKMLETVTAGTDRSLRLTHCAAGLERQDCEISQGAGLEKRAKKLGLKPSEPLSRSSGWMDDHDVVAALGGSAALRLPPVTAMAVSDRREGQWAGVVTAHRGLGAAYIWDYSRKAIGDRVLVLPGRSQGNTAVTGGEAVVSVTISACGSFAVLGGSRGTVAMFNLQTGAARGCFPALQKSYRAIALKGKKRGPNYEIADDGGVRGFAGDLGVDYRRRGDDEAMRAHVVNPASVESSVSYLLGGTGRRAPPKVEGEVGPGGVVAAHDGAVTGVAVDGRNRFLVTGGADGVLRWWEFQSHKQVGSVSVSSGVTRLDIHRPSGMMSVALDDGSTSVWDVAARRMVRSFSAPAEASRITDTCFSPDGRWLVVAHADGTLRVLDVPAAMVIDWVVFSNPVTSVDFAPAGDCLVTAHRGRAGLSLWSNKAFAQHITVRRPPDEPVMMDLPEAVADSETLPDDNEPESKRPKQALSNDDEEGSAASNDEFVPVGRGSFPLELSGLAASKWETLPYLDMLKERSKPQAAPEKPADAPFFLPTTGGLTPSFQPTDALSSAVAFFTGGGGDTAPLPPSGEDPSHALVYDQLAFVLDALAGIAAEQSPLLGDEHSAPPPHDASLTASLTEAAVRRATAQVGDDEEYDPVDELLDQSEMVLETLSSSVKDFIGTVREEQTGAAWVVEHVCRHRQVTDGLLCLVKGVPAVLLASVWSVLASLSPARADATVTSLCMGPADLPGRARLLALLRALSFCLAHRRGMDIAQAHVGLLLRVHGDTVASCPELRRAVSLLRPEQRNTSEALCGMLDHVAGVARWVLRAV